MVSFLLAQIPHVFTIYNLILLGRAALTTLALSAVGCIIGLIFGFVLSLARLSHRPIYWPLRGFAFIYVEIVRRIPFLITLMIFFFGAQVAGFNLAPLSIAFISTSVISTAFVAEIVRAGLTALRPSQMEAATAMNFSA